MQVCRERREGSRRKGGIGTQFGTGRDENRNKRKDDGNSRRETGRQDHPGRRERPKHLPCKAERTKAL